MDVRFGCVGVRDGVMMALGLGVIEGVVESDIVWAAWGEEATVRERWKRWTSASELVWEEWDERRLGRFAGEEIAEGDLGADEEVGVGRVGRVRVRWKRWTSMSEILLGVVLLPTRVRPRRFAVAEGGERGEIKDGVLLGVSTVRLADATGSMPKRWNARTSDSLMGRRSMESCHGPLSL